MARNRIGFLIVCMGLINAPLLFSQDNIHETRIDPGDIVREIIIGGNVEGHSDAVGIITSRLDDRNDDQYAVFLGNTLPKEELDKDSDSYAFLESQLGTALAELRDRSKQAYFIPGNNEWYDGRNYTVDGLRQAEKFIQAFSDDKNRFRPSKGCGEPDEIDISDETLLLLIDSQWMMQGDSNEERKKSSCEIDNNFELIASMKEIIGENKHRHIIIASHHPLYSAGKLGGNYSLKNHLLPLPVLGSIITGIRKLAVDDQQPGHPDYEAYRAAMESVLANCDNCIVLSSHENNLQYHTENNNHFFTVGSGPRSDYVRKSRSTEFAVGKSGYARILQLNDASLVVELYDMASVQKPAFRKHFRPRITAFEATEDEQEFLSSLNHGDSIVTMASGIYGKKKFLRGQFYREAWKTNVSVPVVFLDSLKGGLKPVQQGGGFQTQSLRLENDKGQQWVMRSINKDVEKLIPPALRGTFAQNMVQDGIASSHPYGAFAIPYLAEKAGIYHANPIMVYLPHQDALGTYNRDFGNKLYLFEERPGGNASEFPDYGFPEETVNTLELLDNLEKSHKHRVDQKSVLRARLFDIWVGDWDRHDDQWRWGGYPENGITVYRPIPRDRDQVFFKNDGVLDYLVSRPYFNPGLRKFDHTIDFLPGLIFNARYFDRSFLNALTEEDFIAAATELVERLNDSVIENAFNAWPREIRAIDKDEIVSKLKSRRSDLVEYARAFYTHISRELTVAGTNDQDIFEIRFQGRDSVSVDLYHEKRKEDHHIYSRIINPAVTKELRLFGLEKDDRFILSGKNKTALTVRIIGGSGDDEVTNQSPVQPIVYDRPKGMELKEGAIISRIADVNGVNRYDRKDWKQDRFWQFPLPSFYTDEGPGISYNIWWKNYGFRTDPYKSDHKLSMAVYARNRAFNINYAAYFPEMLASLDFGIDFDFNGPSFTQFFYGFGNEYIDYEQRYPGVANAEDQRFHIVKGLHLDMNSFFVKTLNQSSRIILNPSVEFYDLKNTDGDPRYYLFDESGITEENLESKLYPAIGLSFLSSRIDNPGLPSRGYRFELSADFKYNLSNSTYKNLNLATALSAYIPFNQEKSIVLASELGFGHLVGEAEFFHLNYLANQSRLRGFRTNRFSGQTIAYHSNDFRIGLLRSKGDLPALFGLVLSFDYGRAWFDENEGQHDTWHSSYGGGLFFAPVDLVGFRFAYFKSPNEFQLSLGGSLSF